MSESGRRRRPLRPLPPQLAEPVRDFTGELRQIYWERTELNQRELAAALHLTKSPVSRYLSGQEIIPPGPFAEFCRIAGLTSREQQRLGKLREKAVDAAGTAPLPQADPSAPRKASAAGLKRWMTALPGVMNHSRALPVVVAVVILAATAGTVMALNGHEDGGRSPAAALPGPSGSTGCRTTRVYRVIGDGDILDSKRKDIGDVHVDDVFGLDEAPSAGPYRFRDYGHVVGNKVRGYVDQAKLKPLGHRCMRDVERNNPPARGGG
ncbi:MAG TPA: helix-turn-helix transcriptional regulator [Streptomyces sp.]|nr:helix-turn-helix transcriptional regulator [Streptomyces sp.]